MDTYNNSIFAKAKTKNCGNYHTGHLDNRIIRDAHKLILYGKGVNMEYTKPVVLAQNSKEQSFAAGCPPKDYGDRNPRHCKDCERTA